MSETETVKGKIKIFKKNIDETLSQYVTRFIKKKNLEQPSNITDENAYEIFCEYFYKECVIINDVIYEVIENVNYDDGDDIFDATLQQDGTIDYVLKYYNGGCSFGEALEYALEKLNTEKNTNKYPRQLCGFKHDMCKDLKIKKESKKVLEIEGYKLICSDEIIILHCGRYGNGRLAISASYTPCWAQDDGGPVEQPFATLTVNLPEQKLWPREIFVKTWSENKNFAASVLKENLFIDTGRRVITGHCEAEVWKLADNVISSEEAPKTCYGLGIKKTT